RLVLQQQLAAAGGDTPLQLARQRRAAALHDARRAVAEHVSGRLDDLWKEHVVQIDAQREVADALEVGVELGRGGARDALIEPLAIGLLALVGAWLAQQHGIAKLDELRELT